MLLNVQELALRKEPVTLKETFDAAPIFAGMRDVKPLGPLTAELTAYYVDRTIEVTGTIACKVQLFCSRCLDPIEQEMDVPFRETFKVVSKETADSGEQDDEEFVPIQGERLELRPYVEEQLLLHLPLAPICREDCQGLCPECGTNRNEQQCGCSTEKIDPRLASLKDWFGQ
ncbi:DUF177 domain-containing protein [Cohnella lubricantis]|uniref:DUF177 domain-containing protein n=1 Tax=Cohnella lubricantis TaxID=2163172 RepID=A0A841T6K8_9BACL|nr:DUF177 domain-containing protein [Cohnella lubricantis]MBB6677173.1 DUF177 domain-containing protein [Cohnella lubricantis]MBP2117016.1 uncharacterized protein [Cohnella lubricantis]